jgi:transcriptional regulator with XRE-family HTH domain
MEFDVRLLREFSGLDQREFWNRVGVTQSGGSRYENGRRLPKPVQQLLRLIYIEKVDMDTIKRADLEVITYLKAERKDLLKELKHASMLWHRKHR